MKALSCACTGHTLLTALMARGSMEPRASPAREGAFFKHYSSAMRLPLRPFQRKDERFWLILP